MAIAEANAADDADATVAVTRYSFETLAVQLPSVAAVPRFTSMAIAEANAADDADATVAVTRYSFETLALQVSLAHVPRFTSMAIAEANAADDADATVAVTRSSFEVLAPRFIQLASTALPGGLTEYFANNWANSVEIETTYRTDITRGAQSVAEDRVQVWERPERVVKMRWTEIGPDEKQNLERLLTQLRRMQAEQWVVPIYPDHPCVTEDAASGQPIIKADVSRGRFFTNTRVLVVPIQCDGDTQLPDGTGQFHFSSIATKVSDEEIVLADDLSFPVTANMAVIIPMIVVHPKLQIEIKQHHSRLWDVTLEFEEVKGTTTLPPLQDDQPDNFDQYRGIPILRSRHNYKNPLSIELFHEGEFVDIGRSKAVHLRGEFARVKHPLKFIENREIGWDYISFFDSRRGRLRAFWFIDQEDIFRIVDLTSTFIDIDPIGDFADFNLDMEFFGFEMKDGTDFVREITTIQSVAGVFRLTVADTLPALDPNDVKLAGRAHLTRMLKDSLIEKWRHFDLVELSIPVISLLEEKNVDLTP
jgi:hypothetical protein